MRVLVAGGTGYIGRRLVSELLDAGHEVCVLTRSQAKAQKLLDASCRIVEWDLNPESTWAEEIASADALVNLSGENLASGRWSEKRQRLFLQSRIDSTRALVEAVRNARQRPKVLINSSAIGFYPAFDEKKITEETPPGKHFLASLCTQWESEALKIKQFHVRVVLLRIGLVIGPDSGLLKKMLPPFRLGLGGPLGSGRQWMSWIHVDDVVGLILLALQDAHIEGPINATAPGAVRNREFTATLAHVLHRPAFFRVPAFALKLALGEQGNAALMSQRVLPEKALYHGYNFRYTDIGTALRDALTKDRT